MADDRKLTVDDYMLAAQRGDCALLEKALAGGIKVNAIDAHGNSALMYAAAAGQARACRLLIDRGIDKDTRNDWGLSAREWSKWPANADDIRKLVY